MVSLSRYGRIGASLKDVARDSGFPLRTVQRAVRRLLEIEEVLEPTRGSYVLAATYHDLTSDPTALLGFQNLRFKVSNWRLDPMPPCRTARVWDTESGGTEGIREVAEFQWSGRSIKLIWHPRSETLDVWVRARDPIPLDRAGELGGWLTAMLGLERGESTEAVFIEVNSDHKLLRLEPTYIELRDLPRTAKVLYQHGDALRQEFRLAKPEDDGKPLQLSKALEALVYASPLARMERLLDKELDLARSQVARSAPRRTAPASPAEDREAGYG